jgi:hypothetical protein
MPRRRSVLVAKCLTNSDASSGRIILPRVAVETNLPFVTPYRHYALPVTDCQGELGWGGARAVEGKLLSSSRQASKCGLEKEGAGCPWEAVG